MRIYISILLFFLVPLLLYGCTKTPGEHEGGKLKKEQVLKLDPDADIFELNNKVYKTNIDWIENEKLTKDKELGKIEEGMATKLPIGAKIFTTKEMKNVLIIEYDQTEKKYLLQIGE